LPDSNTSVDASALLEEGSDSAAGTLGSNEDNVNILGGNNVGVILVDDGETVREVESLALGDERSNGGPGLGLGSVGEEVHDDGTSVDGLLDGEESFAGNPTILNGLPPGLAILADTDDDIETIVAGVQTLAVALRTVANEGEGIVLEVVLELGKRPVASLKDGLLGACKVESLDATGLLGCKTLNIG
jgi:hypothetical protein